MTLTGQYDLSFQFGLYVLAQPPGVAGAVAGNDDSYWQCGDLEIEMSSDGRVDCEAPDCCTWRCVTLTGFEGARGGRENRHAMTEMSPYLEAG